MLHKSTHWLVIIILGILLFVSGFRTGQYSRDLSRREPRNNYNVKNFDNKNTTDLDFSLFWEAWNALEDYYVDKEKVDPKVLYYGAIKGMVASLNDNYTFFLTPDENQQSKDDLNGNFEGIGAELGLESGQVIVVSPLKDSPAEKAGVKPGDAILKVNGESTRNWTLNQAVKKIRGPKGQKVVLNIYRKGETSDLTIIRDTINVPSLELTFEGNTAVLELSRFGDNTNHLWDEAVNTIVAHKNAGTLDGIVLDMRGNPGGYLDSAVYISAEFLREGDLVVKQEYADKDPDEYFAQRDGKLQGTKLVILINEGSASASEIVAGSLRDNQKATLVGMNSFGKGTVQQALDLKNGAGIHVTISKWVLPKGDWINEKGVAPSVKVENPVEEKNTLTKEKDLQLQKALEVARQ